MIPVLLVKAHVKGHYRTEPTGKRTYVKDYDDSRQRQLELFAQVQPRTAAQTPARPAMAEAEELAQVEKNLRANGVDVRDYPLGHMIMPNGKGVAPTSSRGIANHYEVAIDAGYVPRSELEHLTLSPGSIVNGLLKKGWIRNAGSCTYQVWDRPQGAVRRILEEILTLDTQHEGAYYHAYLDVGSEKTSYRFTMQDFIDNDFNLPKTLYRAEKHPFEPEPPLPLTLQKSFIPVLLVKAHVRAYDRHTKEGQTVHVGEYDTRKPSAKPRFFSWLFGREKLTLTPDKSPTAAAVMRESAKRLVGVLREMDTPRPRAEEPPPAEAKTPAAAKPQTAPPGKTPTAEAAPKADAPPGAVTTGVKRIATHGENGVARDFANLPGQEHFQFERWLAVYDKALAEDTDKTLAEKYMTVVRKMAGLSTVPQPEEASIKTEPESGEEKQALRAAATKAEDGLRFIIPEGKKGMTGTWEKITIAGEPYFKKGEKYLRPEAFYQHADIIQKQIASGGVKKPTPVLRAKAKAKAEVKPLEHAGEAGEAQATPSAEVKEGTPLKIPANLTGKEAKVWTEKGTEVQVRYAVVPRANLITSHDTALKKNPQFPQALQPRERGRAGLEDQVTSIASKLNPERLGENPNAGDGAPIISPDGVVESGNGRVIALNRLYEGKHENAGKYQSWLKENAGHFGLTAEAVDGVTDPVLVRIRTSEVNRQAFVHEANVPTQAAMSPSEKAQADAKKLTPDIMKWFAPSEDGDMNVNSNAPFIGRFFQHVVSKTEQNELLTANGKLNDDGARRVRNAVLAHVYPNPELIERLVEDASTVMQNVGRSLLAESGHLAVLKGGLAEAKLSDLDPTPEIAEAARTIMYLKEQDIYLTDYLNQPTLEGKTVGEEVTAFLTNFADNIRKPKAIREFIGTYVKMAEGVLHDQTGFLKQQKPTKLEVIEATKRAVAQPKEEDDEARLFKSESQRAGRAGALIPVLVTTKNHEAGAFRDTGRKEKDIPERAVRGRTAWRGLTVDIEQPVNSVRYWTEGGTRFAYAYGEFPDVMGRDGDPLDVFLGPDRDAGQVYVITIMKHPDFTEEDEEKVMVGFRSQADAVNAFLLHYDDPRMMGKVEAHDAAAYAAHLHFWAGARRVIPVVRVPQARWLMA